MLDKNKKYSGYLLTEMMVTLVVLGMLLTVLALSLDGFAKFNRYQLVRQQCISAARAELDSIAVTAAPIPEEDFERLWPGLSVSIRQSPGVGQWKAAKLVSVTVTGSGFKKEVEIQINRYILDEKRR